MFEIDGEHEYAVHDSSCVIHDGEYVHPYAYTLLGLGLCAYHDVSVVVEGELEVDE